MTDILRFPFIKTISTVVYDKAFGLTGTPQPTPIDQSFIYKIRYGNLLKDSGDKSRTSIPQIMQNGLVQNMPLFFRAEN